MFLQKLSLKLALRPRCGWDREQLFITRTLLLVRIAFWRGGSGVGGLLVAADHSPVPVLLPHALSLLERGAGGLETGLEALRSQPLLFGQPGFLQQKEVSRHIRGERGGEGPMQVDVVVNFVIRSSGSDWWRCSSPVTLCVFF